MGRLEPTAVGGKALVEGNGVTFDKKVIVEIQIYTNSNLLDSSNSKSPAVYATPAALFASAFALASASRAPGAKVGRGESFCLCENEAAPLGLVGPRPCE